jgi:hypothetical protein
MSYYRHSGKISLPLLLPALLVACAAAFALAWVYAYAILYIPLAYVSMVLTLFFGLGLGTFAGMAVLRGKARNGAVVFLASSIVALAGFYAAWAVWIYAFFSRAGVKDVSFFPILTNPTGLFYLVELVNEKGAWSIHGSTTKGVELWIIWALEAALIIGVPPILTRRFIDRPFCEECGMWCAREDAVAWLAPTTRDEARARLESKDFAWFGSLGLVAPDALHYSAVGFAACSKCRATSTISLDEVTITFTKKGQRSESKSSFVKDLLLDERELESARAALAALQAPAAPPPSPPSPPSA